MQAYAIYLYALRVVWYCHPPPQDSPLHSPSEEWTCQLAVQTEESSRDEYLNLYTFINYNRSSSCFVSNLLAISFYWNILMLNLNILKGIVYSEDNPRRKVKPILS